LADMAIARKPKQVMLCKMSGADLAKFDRSAAILPKPEGLKKDREYVVAVDVQNMLRILRIGRLQKQLAWAENARDLPLSEVWKEMLGRKAAADIKKAAEE